MILAFPFVALFALGTIASWLGCLVPFAAISAAAALHLRTRAGIALVGAVWALNQTFGFMVHGYPHTAGTFAWGAALGVAAFAAFFAARAFPSRWIVAGLGAFAAFELVLVAFSTVLGGWGAYAPLPLLDVFAVNAVWFVLAHAVFSSRVLGFNPSR